MSDFVKVADHIINKNKVVKVIGLSDFRSRIVLSGFEIKPVEVGLSLDELLERLNKSEGELNDERN